MKRQKEFVSSDEREIEAELLRLMRNPKCYAITLIALEWDFVRLIERSSPRMWKCWVGFSTDPLGPAWYSLHQGKIQAKFAEHVAYHGAYHSGDDRTLIVGWFA